MNETPDEDWKSTEFKNCNKYHNSEIVEIRSLVLNVLRPVHAASYQDAQQSDENWGGETECWSDVNLKVKNENFIMQLIAPL